MCRTIAPLARWSSVKASCNKNCFQVQERERKDSPVGTLDRLRSQAHRSHCPCPCCRRGSSRSSSKKSSCNSETGPFEAYKWKAPPYKPYKMCTCVRQSSTVTTNMVFSRAAPSGMVAFASGGMFFAQY